MHHEAPNPSVPSTRKIVGRPVIGSTFWGAAACLGLLGCGGGSSANTAHLQGSVQVGGVALSENAQGGVSFRPAQSAQGRETFARIVNGRYDSPNTPQGAVKVFFSIDQPTGRMMKSERTGENYPELQSVVPAKYGAGMDLDVTGDNADQNFNLEK